jgi:hypothetical protein
MLGVFSGVWQTAETMWRSRLELPAAPFCVQQGASKLIVLRRGIFARSKIGTDAVRVSPRNRPPLQLTAN